MESKRPSGGKRAVERKHRAREAVRGENYNAESLKRYARVGKVPKGKPEAAHQWLADIVLTAIHEAATDPGLPPEHRREQIGRLAAQAAKVLEPAKLSAKLAEYERALQELSDAPQVDQRSYVDARPPATLS